jgi:mersacidin/lichenicidin family type 2 lantibiotic
MSNASIIRAWKDADYRASLSPDEQALVPSHPAGLVELADADLEGLAGGRPYTTTGDTSETYFTNCTWGWRCQ